MAEGLLKLIVSQKGQSWRIGSAGVFAKAGYPAAEFTLAILNSNGIDLSAHHSRIVTSELIDQYNLVLTMEQGQKEALISAFPNRKGSILLLSEIVDGRWDIVDPVGGEYLEYLDTAREIKEILEAGFEQIQARASSTGDKNAG